MSGQYMLLNAAGGAGTAAAGSVAAHAGADVADGGPPTGDPSATIRLSATAEGRIDRDRLSERQPHDDDR